MKEERQAAILKALRQADMTIEQLEAATGYKVPGMAMAGLVRRGLAEGRNGELKGGKRLRIYSIGKVLTYTDEIPLLCGAMGMKAPKAAKGERHNLTDERHNNTGLSCVREVGIQSSMG